MESTKYKILHYISGIDLASGGPARSMPSICLAMQQVDVYCEVHARQTENPNDKKLKEAGIPVILVNPPSGKIKSLFSKFLLQNVDFSGAIVHIQNIWDLALHWVAKECKKQNVPYVISPRGMLEPWSMNQKKIKKELAMAIYQWSDLQNASCIHTTAISEMEHVRALGVKCPIAVIPNGINVSDYEERKYDIKKNEKKRMLFLSRIHPKKGIDLLLKAWSQLSSHLTEKWELVIAGEGGGDYTIDDLKALIAKDYSAMNVVVAGPQYGEDKTKMYQSADLFVLPTHSENFGMVIAEAMCCGVPVITTTGTPWVDIREKNLGWYIELSVDNLKETFVEAMNLSDIDLHERGKRSREYILNEYSIESIAHKYKSLYDWIYGLSEKPEFVYLNN